MSRAPRGIARIAVRRTARIRSAAGQARAPRGLAAFDARARLAGERA